MNEPMRSGTETTCARCGDQVWVPGGEDPNDTLCVPCADERDAGETDEDDWATEPSTTERLEAEDAAKDRILRRMAE